jgi:pSer/pThr/pTyr-binding forkhead associated (FHA) protein
MVEARRRIDLDVIDSVVHELRWQWFEEHPSGEDMRHTAATPSPDDTVSVMVYRSGQLLEQADAHRFPFVIGRSNANDLVVIDKEVSRRHALIDCIGGIYVIEDLNSKNGILVNQKRRARALLRSGDIISFGQVDVVFYLERKRDGKATTRTVMEDKPRADVGDDTANSALLTSEDADSDNGARRQASRED